MNENTNSKVVLTSKNYFAEAQMRHHYAATDMLVTKGGSDNAPTPMEYLLTAIGGCVSITLRIYAENKGWDLGEITVNMTQETIKTENGIQKKLIEQISFEKRITDNQRKRLLSVAGKCPIAKMVKEKTEIVSVIV